MCNLVLELPDDHQLFKFFKLSVRNAKINTVFSQLKSYHLCNDNELCLAISLTNVHLIPCKIDLGKPLHSPNQRKTFNYLFNCRILLTEGSKCNLSARDCSLLLFTDYQISSIL